MRNDCSDEFNIDLFSLMNVAKTFFQCYTEYHMNTQGRKMEAFAHGERCEVQE